MRRGHKRFTTSLNPIPDHLDDILDILNLYPARSYCTLLQNQTQTSSCLEDLGGADALSPSRPETQRLFWLEAPGAVHPRWRRCLLKRRASRSLCLASEIKTTRLNQLHHVHCPLGLPVSMGQSESGCRAETSWWPLSHKSEPAICNYFAIGWYWDSWSATFAVKHQ